MLSCWWIIFRTVTSCSNWTKAHYRYIYAWRQTVKAKSKGQDCCWKRERSKNWWRATVTQVVAMAHWRDLFSFRLQFGQAKLTAWKDFILLSPFFFFRFDFPLLLFFYFFFASSLSYTVLCLYRSVTLALSLSLSHSLALSLSLLHSIWYEF